MIVDHSSTQSVGATARSPKISKILNYLSLLAILFGVFIRVLQYLHNRSLWGDEAYLALNIVDRSYGKLLQPLDYYQAAPPGFLWVEKLAIQVFGNNEYALRLFPLIAGIVSLFALYRLGQWAVSAIALPIALILFACLKYPLYYATEVKQYSSDIMVTLLLCLLLIPLRDRILSKKQTLLIGFLGIVSLWFSHTAIFVLAGIAAAELITIPAKRRKMILLNRLPIYLIWAVSFCAYYFLLIQNILIENDHLQNSWSPEYPGSIFDIIWLLDSFGRIFYRPLGFLGKADGVALAAFIIGSIVFFKKYRTKFLILIAPVVATLIASYLHKYPFRARLILFLAPFFILILAEGVSFLLSHFKSRRQYVAVVGALMACVLILPPVFQAGRFMVYPEGRQEIRPVIEYIKAHQQPQDGLYVDNGILQFAYYAKRYGYSRSEYVAGKVAVLNLETFSPQEWENFKRQSSHLKDKQQVWFLFAGIMEAKEMAIKQKLDQIGQAIDYFKQPGALTYLYRLNQ